MTTTVSTLILLQALAGPGAADGQDAATAADTVFEIAAGTTLIIEQEHLEIDILGTPDRRARLTTDGAPGFHISRPAEDRTHVMLVDPDYDVLTELFLSLPPDVNLDIRLGTGHVRVMGIDSSIAIRSLDDVDIEIEDSGPVRVESLGLSDVTLTNVSGGAEIYSVDGDVWLHRVEGPISIEAVTADIEVYDVVSQDVRLRTLEGDLLYDGPIADSGNYSLSTQHGDITFALPLNAHATLSATTFDGEVEFTSGASGLQPLGSAPPGAVRQISDDQRRIETVVGNGSARISLSSFEGDVAIVPPGEGDAESRSP